MTAIIKKTKNAELKKHVSTIHCANALTLLQRKIANALLYHAYDELLKQDEHSITIRELSLLIGYESHDSKTIKNALVDLLKTVIEWNIIEQGSAINEEEWNASSIIAAASIKSGVCTYSYSHKMKQLLHMPAMYGRLNMDVQACFKSSYGLALYENAIRFQNLPSTPWFELETFRKLMGVASDKYCIFRDFKRRVIDKAITEVNQFSPVNVYPEFKKEKRQVVALRFCIEHKKQASKQLDQNEVEPESLVSRLTTDFGLSKKQAAQITGAYDDAYILEKIALVEASSSFKNGKIVNLAQYIISALKEDYQPAKSSRAHIVKQKQINDFETAQARVLQKQKESKKKVELEKQAKEEMRRFAQLSEAEQRQTLEAFEASLKESNSDFILQLYKKEGLNSKFVEVAFREFFRAETQPLES